MNIVSPKQIFNCCPVANQTKNWKYRSDLPGNLKVSRVTCQVNTTRHIEEMKKNSSTKCAAQKNTPNVKIQLQQKYFSNILPTVHRIENPKYANFLVSGLGGMKPISSSGIDVNYCQEGVKLKAKKSGQIQIEKTRCASNSKGAQDCPQSLFYLFPRKSKQPIGIGWGAST